MKTPQKKRQALGRGLNALLGDKPTPEVLAQATLISISKIKPNKYQPRSNFDKDELQALANSIKRDGVLMPILIRPQGDGYELIAGERRWRASQMAKLHEIPAVVREVDDLQALELAIVENEQRDDLTAVESARAYRRLMEEFNYTQQQVAESIGVSRVQVSNLIRLLQLPEAVQVMLEERKLNMGHARPLVGLAAVDAITLAKTCVEKGWSARQMEKEARKANASKPAKNEIDADIQALSEELKRNLGLTVSLTRKKDGSGEVKIAFAHKQELDRIIKSLRGYQ
ncbi:ParB/RepB/Spo0J family partition protein [Ghiorsea bivora]|uniref:ParB/RepB/Spo0J family partition protein n=1 Tax=Ghiorsea bivora TaxID=1485545 RepID=UPI000570662F|nr:ParB/RepB/Spo0J family partition protein [Ghiorsea bivora]